MDEFDVGNQRERGAELIGRDRLTNENKSPDTVDEAGLSDTLSWFGWRLTGVYLSFLLIMTAVAWEKLFFLDPNEFGDMLSGIFAPLAFLWLVLGFYQQGKELKASVAALKLQGEELRNSVEQQRELVAVTREQLEAEINSARESRDAAERAAQAVWVPMDGGSYTGTTATMTLGVKNVGADATQVGLWLGERRLVERDIIVKNDQISTKLEFKDASDMRPLSLYVTYFDTNGQERGRRFSYEVLKGEGPNGRDRLRGTIEETLYKPPFPWIIE